MKKSFARVIASILSLLIVILSSYGVCAEKTADQINVATDTKALENNGGDTQYHHSIENENFKLSLNEENGLLCLYDKRNNKSWYSNPLDWEKDETASGITRTNLRSQIIVEYIEGNSRDKANNLVSSINRGGAKFNSNNNCIRAEYTFVNEGFYIPVEYHLTDNGFKAKILTGQIKESGECKIYKILLLPFFGAGGINESGYMFIPDGSGAVIEFNNGKQEYTQYEKAVYGNDLTIQNETINPNEKNILLPLYGIKNGNDAFSAIITNGAEIATIYSEVSGSMCSYNRVYSSVTYRDTRSINLKNHTGKNISALFSAVDPIAIETYEVTYSFLERERANYIGMAEVAKKWLSEKGLGENGDLMSTPIFLDFYGAVKKEKAFLGIRYSGTEKLTTFDQAKKILKTLESEGIQGIRIGYYNFSTVSLTGKVNSSIKYNSLLGSGADYKKLYKYAEDNKTEIYPYADFISFSKNGKGYNRFKNVALGLDLKTAKNYPYSIVSNMLDKAKKATYLISSDSYNRAIKSLIGSFDTCDISGVLLRESCNSIYSDYSKGGYQKDRTAIEMVAAYEKILKEKKQLMLSAPNAYAMPYASAITDLPVHSSRCLVFDYDVPFLQIAFSGLVNYSYESININGTDDAFLKHIETGSFAKFSVIDANSKAVQNTEFNYLYGASFDNCFETICEWYEQANEFYKAIKASSIVFHEDIDGVVNVIYSNGTKVTINYTENECLDFAGKSLKAKSFSYAAGA